MLFEVYRLYSQIRDMLSKRTFTLKGVEAESSTHQSRSFPPLYLMNIVKMNPNQSSQIAAFIARLQADKPHQIAYFGNNEAEIAAAIQTFYPPYTVLLAYDDNQLIGLLRVDTDSGLKFHDTIPDLFRGLLPLLPMQAARASKYRRCVRLCGLAQDRVPPPGP